MGSIKTIMKQNKKSRNKRNAQTNYPIDHRHNQINRTPSHSQLRNQ